MFVFNALHDQAAPDRALERIRHACSVPGGVLSDGRATGIENFDDNVGNPLAPFTYAVSTLNCLTVSLAVGGACLRTALGEQVACRMLADAGFDNVVVHDAPGNAAFVTRTTAV